MVPPDLHMSEHTQVKTVTLCNVITTILIILILLLILIIIIAPLKTELTN